jgi:nitrogen fixation/metabolism regulation signal transduction histidine kinase
VADRAAHEIKNPLNGLALNLEVVRSRSVRPGADGSALAPFATAASSELERVLPLVEALLSLARPLSVPVDLQTAIRPLAALYGAIAGAGGGSLQISNESEQMFVAIDGTTVRTLLAEVLDAAVAPDRAVAGILARDGASISLRLAAGLSRPISAHLLQLGARHDVRLSADTNETLLLFPALAHPDSTT